MDTVLLCSMIHTLVDVRTRALLIEERGRLPLRHRCESKFLNGANFFLFAAEAVAAVKIEISSSS